mgnify:CR=1 FL=1
MIIGLIKEGKLPRDRRAVLTPHQCKTLLNDKENISIIVEPSEHRIFKDSEYDAAGCILSSNLSSCDLLLGVKEVPIEALISNKTYFFFSHTYKEQKYNRDLLKACLDKQIYLIDWELLKMNQKRLIGFGYYAGSVGAYESIRGYGIMTGKYHIPSARELGTIDKIKNELKKIHLPNDFRAVITGTGKVAIGAEEIFVHASIEKCNPSDYIKDKSNKPRFTVLKTSDYVKRISDGKYDRNEFYQNPELYENSFQPYTFCSDLFLPCHFWKEGSPPFFELNEISNPNFRISFVGDISCDIAGPVATTIRPSTLDDPFYSVLEGKEVDFGQEKSIGVLAVDNLPSAVPMDATHGFGKMFLEGILPAFFNNDANNILKGAAQTKNGQLCPNYKYLQSYVHGFDLSSPSTEEIESSIIDEIKSVKNKISLIINNKESPSFENTILPLEQSDENLERLTELLFNYNSACTNPAIQEAAKSISPKLSSLSNDILSNKTLFERITFIEKNELGLDHEDLMLLSKYFKNFSRNGGLLDNKNQSKLRLIDERLSSASLEFSEHVLADTEKWFRVIKERNTVGLPISIIEMVKQAAIDRGLEDYCLTLDAPIYLGFMTYSSDRIIREELWRAYNKRSARGDSNDNTQLVLEISELRRKRAKLLGYRSHASFVLEERMAKDPLTVYDFLESLKSKALPAAKKEVLELKYFAKNSLDLPEIKKWDIPFVVEKFKKEKLNYNDEITKPYFSINQVLNWAFSLAERLYGLEFKLSKQQAYRSDVQVYDVTSKNGDWVGHMLTDWHPRKGKRNGAWMTSYRKALKYRSREVYPVVSLVCNFSTSSKGQVPLLTFNEVLTLFHEFGHGLHGILGKGKYSSLTGTSVAWDFVELPSQFMENWCFQPTELKNWAKHYKTQKVMPESIISNINRSQKFLEGIATVRQIGLGLLDLAWHDQSDKVENYLLLEESVFLSLELWNREPGISVSPAFSHIFAGGYSAGYYSYKWSEVLDADAFSRFLNDNDEASAAADFKKLLSCGGSVKASILFKNFMGRKPTTEALLKRSGLHG